MHTRISAFAGKVIEGGWLAALIIVPILFNIYTERVFEEDKIPLMRSIALLVLVALLVWLFERGREALEVGGRPIWKVPLVLPALALAGAYILSTIFSIVPKISLWGAYIRRQGTYTWLSYTIIFFGILLLVRHRHQVQRIVTLILLASVPASLYAFLQNQGLDPLPWGGDVVRRVSSTAGNPIFIAAYLIMVFPLTLMRMIENFKKLLAGGEEQEEQSYLAPSLLAGAYLFLLVIQGMTILFSQSRGPLLGLLVGLTFFSILASLRVSRKLTLSITALVVAGILFLIFFNLPNSPLAPLRDTPYIGRLGRVFELNEGTGRVRALIWEGAVDLLAADPLRDIVGYGPESMYVAYNPYYPPELTEVEKRNASPDRAHNETLDALVMTGVLGFLAQTALFIGIFYYGLKWLGLIGTPRRRLLFFLLVLGCATAGGILPYFLDGSFRLSGVGLPAGIVAGLIFYLLAYAIMNLDSSAQQWHPNAFLLITLVSAVIAHFFEAHFGIAIGVTRLYFWIYAALLVVVGMPLLEESRAEPSDGAAAPASAARGRKRRRRAASGNSRANLLTGTLVSSSLMMGLLLAILTFNFYTPALDLSQSGFALIWLFLGTWLFGALAISSESASGGEAEEEATREQGNWLTRIGLYSAISLGIWFLFALFYTNWVNWEIRSPDGNVTLEQVRQLTEHTANNITLLYIFTFLLIGLFALLHMREAPRTSRFLRPPEWQVVVYGLLLLAIIPVIVVTNLDVSRADVYAKHGANYERGQQWEVAAELYEEALRIQPDEDRYFLNLGRTLLEQARSATSAATRDQYMEQAHQVLLRAQKTNPLNTDHTRNLASLHRTWALMSDEPEKREEHLDQAEQYYEEAVQLSPNNAALWNEWGNLLQEQGQFEEAREKLEHSLQLDSNWEMTYLIYAGLLLEMGEMEEALARYERAAEINPESVQALSGKAYVLAQLNRPEEAITVSEQILAIAPDDYNTMKNLALLYEEIGQVERALEWAQAALAMAGPEERPALEQKVRELEQLQSATSPGG